MDFISSKDSEEICTMGTKSHKIEIVIGNKTWYYWRALQIFFAKTSRKIRRKNERKWFGSQ